MSPGLSFTKKVIVLCSNSYLQKHPLEFERLYYFLNKQKVGNAMKTFIYIRTYKGIASAYMTSSEDEFAY